MDRLIIGRGYALEGKNSRIKDISIPASSRTSHMFTFGTTRVGKTKLIEGILEQDIPAGKSVVVIDPKGDNELFSKIVQLAKEHNRLGDLMLFTPIFPEYSVHFNPLKHFYMLEEQVGHIVSGIAAGKDPFFANVAYEISLALVMVDNLIRGEDLKSLKKVNPFSLINVLNEMSHEKIGQLRARVSTVNSPEASQLLANLQKIYESGQDYYNKVSSSLRVALMEECNGNIGKVIGKTNENPFIDRLEQGKPVIFVAQLGSMLTRKSAYTTGKVILSSIQAFVGRFQTSGRLIEPALTVHIDEAQSVLYQGIDELFAKGGSANVYLHGYCQSVNQMYAVINKDYAHAILDNCNTKVFLKVTDAVTAEYISEHFGTKQVLSPIISGTSGGISFRDGEAEFVKPTDIMALPARRFYMLTYEGSYYGKTRDVLPVRLQVKLPEVVNQYGGN